jgi:5,10-methylenetetrahydromethanopterin reductase
VTGKDAAVSRVELWTLGVASPRSVAAAAARAEAAGWDGFAVVDSQNLSGDCYVALAVAAGATERIRLGTGVTNPVTRHPAVTASAIASVQALSGGRAVLGIGRGDSALAHLGRAPAPVDLLERYVDVLQRYLRGEPVDFERLGFQEAGAPPVGTLGLAAVPDASRLAVARPDGPKVPVEVAATGPRVIAAAGRVADRVMLAVGADPARVEWGAASARAERPDVAVGAFVNVVAHPDAGTARALIAGGLATFARFNVMHGRSGGPLDEADRAVLGKLHRAYDMTHHTEVGSPQTGALTAEFVDRFGIAGPPEHCVRRLQALVERGVDKLVLIGPTAGADRDEAARALRLLTDEVLPELR